MSPRVLVGVSPYAARGDAARRQEAALATLLSLRRAEPVNVQFADDVFGVPGLPTLPLLRRSSLTVTRQRGPVKPIAREILDVLTTEAARRGIGHVCLVNADVLVSQAVIDLFLDGGFEGCAYSRVDVDAAGGSLGVQVHGVDAFAVTCGWWRGHRARFRDYILGEPTWDNVYTAILLSHARARIENREGLIRHERHPSAWRESPYAQYTRLLAARDAWYFSRWCEYLERLMRLRAAGAAAEEETALARQVFSRRPTAFERAVQATRRVKARVRYAWLSPRGGR